MYGENEKLRAIVELLIEQATKSNYDYFVFDYSFAQKKALETRDQKYNIKPRQQRDLLIRINKEISGLLKDHGLEDIMNYVDKLDDGTYGWVRHPEWMLELIEPECLPYLHPYEIFVCLSPEAIDFLRKIYDFKVFPATLTYYSGEFAVCCKGKRYILKKQLDEFDNKTGKIMRYAWDNLAKKVITKTEIQKVAGIKIKEPLDACYKNTPLVNTILRPFIKLSSKSIRITNSKKLTLSELEEIEKNSDVESLDI